MSFKSLDKTLKLEDLEEEVTLKEEKDIQNFERIWSALSDMNKWTLQSQRLSLTDMLELFETNTAWSVAICGVIMIKAMLANHYINGAVLKRFLADREKNKIQKTTYWRPLIEDVVGKMITGQVQSKTIYLLPDKRTMKIMVEKRARIITEWEKGHIERKKLELERRSLFGGKKYKKTNKKAKIWKQRGDNLSKNNQ